MVHTFTVQQTGRGAALQGLQAPRPHMPRQLCVRPSALFGKKRAQERQMTRKEPPKAPKKQTVEYGSSWYEKTRAAPTRTTREELGAQRLGPRAAAAAPLQLQAAQRERPAGAPRRHSSAARLSAEFRRQANLAANNGKERKDLYTDNWDGSEYKGSGFNILTLLALLAVLAPILGLFFAYQSYGELWG